MKFVITQQYLREGLDAAGSVVPNKTTNQVHTHLLIETVDKGVRISGTDGMFGLSLVVPATVEQEGAVTVPAKKLQEIAQKLPAGIPKLSLKGQRLELECGDYETKLVTLPASEFPKGPALDFAGGWTIGGGDLQDLADQTSYAVSTEESRPILNGVFWELRPERMRMVATNGHRLAHHQITVQAGSSDAMIVPPTALALASKMFTRAEPVEVARTENWVGFRQGETVVYARLIDGDYPNWEQVVPKDNDKRARFEKTPLVKTLERVAVLASDQTHRIRLDLGGPMARFIVQTPDLGEAGDKLAVDYEGEPLHIGFNAKYLLQALGHIETDKVEITFKGPESAAVLYPVAKDESVDEDAAYALLMPLKLMD